ncbi:outer membrane beta-barrel protein [Singulisphaera acidiphila]|uniref:Beta-barrel porin-2, OmpL-like. bbp2 n=1 Tax=Singulisphaera acidiphila (strain ATCC BAA-1392 / DSM 18658 / VKM B-2454 / MOB10) TaxID=886293 RepID=L0DM87_SINAD|nr:outer membrane beta-barrel protein [Singulisphaera acidiphila]AGA29801.1 Protein of unknown function (DUF1597) [Singulisphaera acidiphila DSM 18658]
MKSPFVRGTSFLALICGFYAAEGRAQSDGRQVPTQFRNAPAPAPGLTPRLLYPGGYQRPSRFASARQELPDGVPTPEAPSPSFPDQRGPLTEPFSPSGSGGTANATDVALPRAERAGGGGEPTEAEAAAETKPAEEAEVDDTKLLMNALGRADAPVKVYGWIQNSYTGNTNGVPPSATNFGVNPNFLANRWMGNQYYLIFENPLEQNDEINFGFRVDNLFGNDWQFNHMRGLFDSSFRLNHFAGYDPAQFYAEVHLPYLTKGGIDIKGGRFYTILGYEVVPATGRPLLSVPYMFNYGQPFTHFGMLSTLHLTDRVNVYNGAVNGWDRWINENYKWNYLGGVSWTSKNGKANLAISYIVGPNQYPNFPNSPQITFPGQTGVLKPNFLAGRRNLGYADNWRTTVTSVLSYKWTDKLTQVMETDQGFEGNIPGIGPGGTNQNASWQSFGNWFLYGFNDKLTGVWRSEVFRDNNGVRTGFADNFYEQTLGLIYKPKPWLWLRPEARYDWAQFTTPYNDGTRNSQFTLAIDAILLY